MRKILAVFVCLAVVCAVCVNAEEAKEKVNSLVNGSFEELDAEGKAEGWESYQAGYEISTEQARTGKNSLKISGTSFKPLGLRQAVKNIPADCTLRFKAWVYMEELESGLCMPVHVSFVESTGKKNYINKKVYADKVKLKTWVPVTMTIDMSKYKDVNTILFWSLGYMVGKEVFSGTFYVDDVSLEIVKKTE